MKTGETLPACLVRSISHAALADAVLSGGNIIFTLNTMHLRLLAEDAAFRESYRHATIVTLDSNFLNRAFLNGEMTVSTGSDFVHDLRDRAVLKDRSVLVIGNVSPREAWDAMPCAHIDVIRPPFGFIEDTHSIAEILERARAFDPDMIFIAVGAPRSERLAVMLRRAGVTRASILCCGAAFEFETGAQKRAPHIFTAAGLEWLWRMTSQPKRLAPRYAADARFLMSLFSQLRQLDRSRELHIGDLRLAFGEAGEERGAITPPPLPTGPVRASVQQVEP